MEIRYHDHTNSEKLSRQRVFIVVLLGVIIGVVYGRTILPLLFSFPLYQDIAQDYLGARALVDHDEELYPILTSAYQDLGLEWNANHQSTHPPTAFLFMVPLSKLPYPIALILWVLAMFICLFLTARAFGISWKFSLLTSIFSLAWPGTIWSLGQLTPIWLLFLALAYRYRHNIFSSGVYIAIASLPKFLAAPALLYHFKKRQWRAVLGFGIVWLTAALVLIIFRNSSLSAYVLTNQGNSLDQIFRADNGALMVVAWRLAGWFGVAIIAIIILFILWCGLKRDDASGWACLVWVGIAILPVAWVYSLLPILPWLIMMLHSGKMDSRLFAGIALLLPYLAPVPTYKPVFIALTILLSGISFALNAYNVDLLLLLNRQKRNLS